MEYTNTKIVADSYQILTQIGAGGGGRVYLAEHLRLHKKVVLKEDSRSIRAKPEALRREVEALKNLSHSYIPQVYDFIVEDASVYTVMDYIEGESFDKPLKRGERFTQAQSIQWACQLLEAIAYLHNRPPHGILHADIKPANVMLTPQGDIRLIDFNIALALGEEGAIAVGRSFGYASPEHYGVDYAAGNVTQGLSTDPATNLTPETSSFVETQLEHSPPKSTNTNSGKKILLDVRSDIYSLGATLYHIISGQRPANDAQAVTPLSTNEFSPPLVAIIRKAMHPNAEQRFQTAEEMLDAFLSLQDQDPRSKRYRTTRIAVASVGILLFLVGGCCSLIGLKQMEQLQNAYVLAEYSRNALNDGNITGAIDFALQALPEQPSLLGIPFTAEAQKALTDALQIYDLSDGFKPYAMLGLPSAPLSLELAPGGAVALSTYSGNLAVWETASSRILATYPTDASALSQAKFVGPDSVLYAAPEGLRFYNFTLDQELWQGQKATSIAISADETRVASVYKDEMLARVYDMNTGQLLQEVDFQGKKQSVNANDGFANPNDMLLALNRDGSLLAVSFADGSLWVYDLKDPNNHLELFDDTSGFRHFEGGFQQQYFAFSATNSETSVFAVIDVAAAEQTGGFESATPFGVQADEDGIYVQTENLFVKINPITGEQIPLVNTSETLVNCSRSAQHTAISTTESIQIFDQYANLLARYDKNDGDDFIQIENGIFLMGSINSPDIRIMKLETHADAELFTYDPTLTHDEARVSADRSTVMLFSYDRFRLYSMAGSLLCDVSIPDAEEVYDQQYRRDATESWLDVFYNDGTLRSYSAKDGSLLVEEKRDKPDGSLHEVFFTDTLRIESPLHGTPTAYDRKSGALIRELEKDAYLTYVTQVGTQVITEYVTADGMRYGLLLNERCETLAYLPYLCDILGETLLFDYPNGHLRQSRIYDIGELCNLAQDQNK